MKEINWSYSSLKTFQQCPKKYYHLKIAKDIKQSDTTATIYGKEVHKAAEDFIKDGTPIPEKYSYMRPILESLNNIEGNKYCEMELGIRKLDKGKYVSCSFTDPNYWWRGIADLVIINGDEAHLVDYKTSKNAKYADTKQLDALASGLFLKFPDLKVIKSALLFVVSNEIVKKKQEYLFRSAYLAKFEPDLERLEMAIKTNVWNPSTSPLCGFCPVKTCVHNKG
jgi:hypothetical protein